MNTETKTWLLSQSKLDWQTTFKVLISPRAIKSVESDETGLSYFVRGFYQEFEMKDYKQALHYYEMGAELLDCLCIFRLHEIYLGDTNFKTELDENKSLCFLAYGSMLNQFESYEKYIFWTKFDAFMKKSPETKQMISNVIANPPVEYFSWISSFLSKAFEFVVNKNGYDELLPELKNLPFDKLKKSFFSVSNALFDILAYAYNGSQSNTEIVDFLNYLLELTTSDLIFDDLFTTFVTHLKLARSIPQFATSFNRRLESNAFWIWTFTYETSMKNHYLSTLIEFEDILLDGTIELKVNTSSWINNYIAYCHEKGCGVPRSNTRALELYQKDINSMPRILFSRFRKILAMQQKGENTPNLTKLVDEVKEITFDRMHDPARMECYLFYVHGKIAEKIEGDLDKAMEWYKKGVESDTFACLKYHLLANEAWRARCSRRLEKVRLKLGFAVEIKRRKSED